MHRVVDSHRLIAKRQRHVAAAKRQTDALAVLNRIGQTLAHTRNLSEICRELLNAAVDLACAECGSMWLNNTGEMLNCEAVLVLNEYSAGTILRLPPDEGLVGSVAQDGKPASLLDPYRKPALYPDITVYGATRITSLVAVPLRVQDRCVGVLEVANKKEGTFDAQDMTLLETLAAFGAMAIGHALLNETLHRNALELRQHREDLDIFARTVAHDVKQPVSFMAGYADTLKARCADSSQNDSRLYLDYMGKSSQRLATVADELLMLAEIRNGAVRKQRLNMNQLIGSAYKRLENVIADYGATLDIQATWPDAVGYAPWVDEIWYHLLKSAIKHGGEQPSIELGSTPLANGAVHFWARFNGPAMKPHNAHHSAELSLCIVRRIAEKLGGEFRSDGNTVGFTLPLAFADRQ